MDRDNAIPESPRFRQRFGSIRSASPRAGSMPSDPPGVAADEPRHGRIRCSKHLLQNGSTFGIVRCVRVNVRFLALFQLAAGGTVWGCV